MIIVRHIDRTCLNLDAYLQLCKKYAKGIKKNIVIVFDLRIKHLGTYSHETDHHLIRISPNHCKFDGDGMILDEAAEKFNIISTTIHELFHARQKEELGPSFDNKRFNCAQHVEDTYFSEYYSQSETDARAYENKHVQKAVQYYDSCCV